MPYVKKSYSELLRDPRWQRRRLEVMKQAEFACEKCGSKNRTLHVHHLLYKRGNKPWDYEDHELMCLCDQCHKDETQLWDEIRERTVELAYLVDAQYILGWLDGELSKWSGPTSCLTLHCPDYAWGVADSYRVSFDLLWKLRDKNGYVSTQDIAGLPALELPIAAQQQDEHV